MREVVVKDRYMEPDWIGYLHKKTEREKILNDGYGGQKVEIEVYGIIENKEGKLKSVHSDSFKFKYPCNNIR